MQNYGKFMETPIPRTRARVEDAAPLTTHSHLPPTPERRSTEVDEVRQTERRKEKKAYSLKGPE